MNEEPAEEQKESDSPFELDPDELKVWLEKRLTAFFNKKQVAQRLFENDLSGRSLRGITKEELRNEYGLTSGEAGEIIIIRDRALKGKNFFCSSVLFGST